ncbi:pyruvate formate-lyase-activating protein [Chitinilyticum piscinae]|uniref:Pyruvate formate-lyase-activating enzyme n=1 Tax=Chitinilyticum piscinae TaxID=2866724 RepID=A0A8J7FJQ7_9NEIS|nr:pyruvate formate-lyase-activating protein [Chitinilyticum piscinae]MBE9608832.1 pyruvate formate lyase-activating protein [Chitinilyticum piscinae]
MSDPSKPLGEIFPATVDDQGHLVGYIHSFETGAAVDGPGMRFALFMSGCQFRCLYCHNPDTWKIYSGRQMRIDDVVAEIGKYAKFLKFAGGLTITGGEPLMQAHFVGEVFYRVKKQWGLHTALDTQGFLAAHLDDSWFDNVDLVLLDIKQMNPEKYERLTSKPLQPTLDFARRLIRLKKKIWLRYVLVPGWSDDEADVDALATFLAELNRDGPGLLERVEVLPFHKMGEHKWEELGMKYELTDTPPPSQEVVDRVRSQFSHYLPYTLVC